jgi:hypothetical protein
VGGSRRRTWANRADAATEQEKAAVAQLQRRPRPQRLIPVAKYPKAEREVIVTFDELKRPAGIDDRHLADLALRDVNRNAELPGRQAIPLSPRSSHRQQQYRADGGRQRPWRGLHRLRQHHSRRPQSIWRLHGQGP